MNPIFGRDVLVVQSSEAFDRCVKRFLKAVPQAGQPEAAARTAARPARESYETGSAGPIFAPLAAAGAIIDGTLAEPSVAERFNAHLAELIGATSGDKTFFSRAARSRSASAGDGDEDKSRYAGFAASSSRSASAVQSRSASASASQSRSASASASQSRSASASQDDDGDDDEVLERFAHELDHQLRKRGVRFGRGIKVGHRAIHRDGTAGTVVKITDNGGVTLKTDRGEMLALAADVMGL